MILNFYPSDKLKTIQYFFFLFLCISCGDSRFRGFTHEKEYYYKLRSFGDSEKKITEGDFVKAVITYFDDKGIRTEEIPNSPDGATIFEYKNKEGHRFVGILALLHKGDSATIYNEKFEIRTEIKIIDVFTKKEYDEWIKVQNELGELQEHQKIEAYIKENSITPDTLGNGVYVIEKKDGKGEEVKYGRKIQVSYKGSFLNGRCFDSITVKNPLEFTFGTEGQVIQGLSIVIGKMKEGGKTKIIIPSHLAFGEQGSSTGIIPPFSSLIYEVELIKVITND